MDTKSIQNAIKKIGQISYGKDFQQILNKFLVKCFQRITEKANANVDVIEDFTSEGIKTDIKNSWNYVLAGDTLIGENNSEKAVYIEFGVGAWGERYGAHPNASEAGYQYNVPSSYKRAEGAWNFFPVSEVNIDLRTSNYSVKNTTKQGKVRIWTRGNEAGKYLFNAIMDFIANQEGQTLWQETLNESGVK